MSILARVVLWALLFCFPVAANAQQPSLEMGVGLICNSEEQVQRYLALHKPDQPPASALQLVNDEAQDPNTCSLSAIAFIRGNEGPSVLVTGGRMKITQIVVVAAQTPLGWQRVPDFVQYTAIFEKLEEA